MGVEDGGDEEEAADHIPTLQDQPWTSFIPVLSKLLIYVWLASSIVFIPLAPISKSDLYQNTGFILLAFVGVTYIWPNRLAIMLYRYGQPTSKILQRVPER